MIPRDFIHKSMFVYLYNFTNKKVLLFIGILYIFLLFYFSVNDLFTISIFVLFFMLLFFQSLDINKTLIKEFERYKKYLEIKRTRKLKRKI
jgi:hypothetical protein